MASRADVSTIIGEGPGRRRAARRDRLVCP
jgi:hypothetical protein